MFGGTATKSSGHKPMPSPERRLSDAEVPTDYPMPNSLFPQYSDCHPGFSNPDEAPTAAATAEDDEEVIDFLASDGTPASSMVSPNFNYVRGSKTPEGDKQIPLHIQTPDTIDEDEELVQTPSDFPCLRPPPRRLVIPFTSNKKTSKRVSSEETRKKWTSYRLWAIVFLIMGLLVAAIAIISSLTGGKDDMPNNIASSSNLDDEEVVTPEDIETATAPSSSIFGDGGGSGTNSMLPPIPTLAPVTSSPTMSPTEAPIAPTVPPTTVAPVVGTNRPTPSPTTRAPTLNRNHPMVGILQDVTPPEDLLNPYTPQGEALIWLATTDKQTPSAYPRVVQRFAMVVLDVALHYPEARFWSSRNLHECRWPGVTCNEERHVTEINWARQSLKGTIPPELGLLTHLSSLDIAQNELKGTLDPLYNLHKLKHAYVFENYLTGTISEGLENCRNLTRLFAGHNQLSGSIPQNLKMRPLEWFVVHYNQLTGTIPVDLSFGLTVVFDISHNKITGTIPENFATEIVPNVRHVHLDHNQLTGSIPGTFRELGKGRLRQLYLNDNQFGGAFPDDWYTTKFLNNIDLSNNKFRQSLNDMCLMSVFQYGELVELRADCAICNCERLCRTCSDNKQFLYEYDDDDWTFDDDDDDGTEGDDDDGTV